MVGILLGWNADRVSGVVEWSSLMRSPIFGFCLVFFQVQKFRTAIAPKTE
jgi:F0F1-type ATP synthase assembly protein I